MTWQVFWTDDAENDLTRIWTTTRFRSQWTEAVKRLDDRLAVNPLECGESRSGQERVDFEGPLGCLFAVDVVRRLVVVLSIWPTSSF